MISPDTTWMFPFPAGVRLSEPFNTTLCTIRGAFWPVTWTVTVPVVQGPAPLTPRYCAWNVAMVIPIAMGPVLRFAGAAGFEMNCGLIPSGFMGSLMLAVSAGEWVGGLPPM